jgi:ribulose-phosphate 3-epimerase
MNRQALSNDLVLEVGIKTDPIEYRYSYEWLFDLLAEEGVHQVQLGTFFEIYQLPDAYFQQLRLHAEDRGLTIASVFTAHRELGGFFRDDGPGWAQIAGKNFQRLIDVAALLGAKSVGSNPGAVLRDRMGAKSAGLRIYLQHMKELMRHAAAKGIEYLTIEPMSCLAEPPTLPDEMRSMAEELSAHHAQFPADTCRVGFCTDVAHGYADGHGKVQFDHIQMLQAALPYTTELHLKNTDARFHSTFGFSASERRRGVVSLEQIRDLLLTHAAQLPVKKLIGYLEIGGPKLGRDDTDPELASLLRESLRHCKQTYESKPPHGAVPAAAAPSTLTTESKPQVLIAPSIMCADICRLEDHVHRLEAAGMDLLHFDLMDAHFVPNMPLGLGVLEQLRPKTGLPFDAHLMVENSELFIRELARIGVQYISVHAESATHLDRTIHSIQDHGIRAGVALNPATPLAALDYVIDFVDFVLIMTVNPGFAGQKLVTSALRKIADCRRLLRSFGRDIPIEVDGNVSFQNIPSMVAAGADILVAGSSSIFHSGGTLLENTAKTRQAIAEGLSRRTDAPPAKSPSAARAAHKPS